MAPRALTMALIGVATTVLGCVSTPVAPVVPDTLPIRAQENPQPLGKYLNTIEKVCLQNFPDHDAMVRASGKAEFDWVKSPNPSTHPAFLEHTSLRLRGMPGDGASLGVGINEVHFSTLAGGGVFFQTACSVSGPVGDPEQAVLSEIASQLDQALQDAGFKKESGSDRQLQYAREATGHDHVITITGPELSVVLQQVDGGFVSTEKMWTDLRFSLTAGGPA